MNIHVLKSDEVGLVGQVPPVRSMSGALEVEEDLRLLEAGGKRAVLLAEAFFNFLLLARRLGERW